MRLSQNFTLREFTRSQEGERRGIDMTPSKSVVTRLQYICESYLEPIRAEISAPMVITSGYRPPELNSAIGGSRSSLHMIGLAADFVAVGVGNKDLYQAIQAMTFEKIFDQLILEHSWIHLGVMAPPRGQVFEL